MSLHGHAPFFCTRRASACTTSIRKKVKGRNILSLNMDIKPINFRWKRQAIAGSIGGGGGRVEVVETLLTVPAEYEYGSLERR